MNQTKFIVRTSGFALYLSLVTMVVLLFFLYIIAKYMMTHNINIAGILSFLLLGWGEIFIYKFIVGQRIELNEKEFIAEFSVPAGLTLLPRFQKYSIKIEDIDSVTIATRKYFEEHYKDSQNKGLKSLTEIYRNMYTAVTNKGIVIPIPMEIATRYTPLMYLAPKDKSKKGITVTTKPFSKDGFRKLIEEFKSHSIPVTISPNIGL